MTTILKIYQDIDPMDTPRDWDNLCTMATWHGRYQLGDEQPDDTPLGYMEYLIEEHKPGFTDIVEERAEEFWEGKEWSESLIREWEEIRRDMVHKAFDDHFYSLPLYLYDHSGITISTGSFSCPWDSGQVGFIYLSHKEADKEFSAEYPLHEHNTQYDHVMAIMRGEVDVYDLHLRGEVYGFVLEEDGEDTDSCWGFYGRNWRENGIIDHIDVDEIDEVWYMEDRSVIVSEPFEKEVL